MRYLGVDFGTKKVGLAVSDENGVLAFPKAIFKNDQDLIANLEKFCREEEIGAIVIGESISSSGNKNPVMKHIEIFGDKMKGLNLPIYFEKEFMTTIEARRYQDRKEADDSAAAIMLQRFLDKSRNPLP
jgi:putative Holliday junction resolvase